MTAPAGAERILHAILPGDVADATSPSGGNVYDRRICHDLAALHGWEVRQILVAGSWPRPDDSSRMALAKSLASIPDRGMVLIDGLVGCGVPDIVVPQGHRLRLVLLVHMLLADEAGWAPEVAAGLDALELATLLAADAIVVTSPWMAGRLADRGVAAGRVHVASPGTDPAPLATGDDGVSGLLCVAAMTPHKGQDLLVDALSSVSDLPWTCRFAGALLRAPDFVTRLRRTIDQRDLADRVQLLGPLSSDELAATYATTDLVVLPSRGESYGMVLPEALRRGIPVLATSVGAVPQTLGRAPDGNVPGLLVPPDDAGALGKALHRWLTEPDLRRPLQAAARSARAMLAGWDDTLRSLLRVLDQVRLSRS